MKNKNELCLWIGNVSVHEFNNINLNLSTVLNRRPYEVDRHVNFYHFRFDVHDTVSTADLSMLWLEFDTSFWDH